MMTASRFHAEVDALQLSLPPNMFKFCDMDTDLPYLKMVAITNSKNMYTLRVDLDQFPESIPKVFVTKMLKSKFGNDYSFVKFIAGGGFGKTYLVSKNETNKEYAAKVPKLKDEESKNTYENEKKRFKSNSMCDKIIRRKRRRRRI